MPLPGATCFRRRTAGNAQFIQARLARHLHITHFYQTSHIHTYPAPTHILVYTQPTMSVPWRKHTPHPPTPPSYPSSFGTADSDIDSGSDSADTDAELDAMVQEEWEESLRQMEVVISIIVIPYFGKWFGRQWAFWGTSSSSSSSAMIELSNCQRIAYERYQRIGLGRTFFGLS